MKKSGPIVLPAPINQPRPHAIFTALLCCASGIPLVISGATPGSINAKLSPPFIEAWGYSLSVGGGLCLIAAVLPDRIWSLLIERVGWFLLGGMCLVYGGAVISEFGVRGAFPAGLSIALGAASLWRVGQITSLTRRVHALANAIDRRNDQ